MILREAFDYEFSRLDPTGAHIDPPSVAIYETLMVKNPAWGASPMLAESWAISDDERAWRVRLRPGLRFHSGARCDAAAVLAALEFLRWNLSDGGLWYWDPVDTVRAEGDDVLVFRLHHPYPRLPALLWGTHSAIFNHALRARHEAAFGFDTADGSGPFRMTHWSRECVTAERWPDYPGAPAEFLRSSGQSNIDAIEWIAILDEQARLDALLRGEVHSLHGPPPADVADIAADARFTVIEYPQAANIYLALNWNAPGFGFDDLRLRRAFSLAIDRAELVERALAGRGTPTYGPLPPGDEFYAPEADSGGSYDPAQAGKLLDEAGWHPGADGLRHRAGRRMAFECICQDDAVHRRIAGNVRAQLAGLGIRLTLRFVRPFEEFYTAVAAGPAAFISKWLWQDPLDALIGFCATRGQPFPNWQGASLPELDDAFAGWLRARTRGELRQAAGRVQRIAARDLPYIPLATPNDVWVHAKQLHGWRPYPANLYPFYHRVWFEA